MNLLKDDETLVDPKGSKLLINEAEAARVRAIFALYLEYQTLLLVVRELDRRGWRTKRWRTRKGHFRGGRAFYQLLSNFRGRTENTCVPFVFVRESIWCYSFSSVRSLEHRN